MTPEQIRRRREWQREYMRKLRGSVRRIKFNHVVESVNRNDAAYDPRRDPPRTYRNEFSELLGDPPVGRSALDAKS